MIKTAFTTNIHTKLSHTQNSEEQVVSDTLEYFHSHFQLTCDTCTDTMSQTVKVSY